MDSLSTVGLMEQAAEKTSERDEEDPLEKVKKMHKIAQQDWREIDAFEKCTIIYHSLPKPFRKELKRIAIECFLESYKEDWMKQADDTWKQENDTMLKKFAKGMIFEISHMPSENIMEAFIKTPLKMEATTLKQKCVSCLGFILFPFQKIAELISTVFQKIFSSCYLKKSDKINDEEILKITQELLEILKSPTDIDSMSKRYQLFKSLPLDSQIELKDKMIDMYIVNISSQLSKVRLLSLEERQKWKEENYKVLDQIAFKNVIKGHYDLNLVKVLEDYINKIKK